MGNDIEAGSHISTNGNLHPDLQSGKSTDAPDSQGDLVLRNSRILCFLLQIRCG